MRLAYIMYKLQGFEYNETSFYFNSVRAENYRNNIFQDDSEDDQIEDLPLESPK